jgi:transcriptional regulator with XRE-family HTH domain
MTQAQIATALCVAANTVARWERDERAISRAMAKHIENTAAEKSRKGKP